ncbi:MAG TPA: NUDIX hydrolase [Burkholderiales bacterium]|nr:NUDIX hydrolase [Burkholderiales bacterium]
MKPPLDLTEHQLQSEAVFDGVLLHVKRDQVGLPDGSSGIREYIVHPGAVAILPLFDDGCVLLERQYRYPLAQVLIEIPAGKIDPGESTEGTAKRELLEETGYVAAKWSYMTAIHPLCAYSTERVEIWLARGLSKQGSAQLDAGEFLETFTLSVTDALEWVRDGRISDVKTIIAIQWAEKILNGQWPAPD